MSRTKGTFSLTSNIEPKFGAPLDARTIVKLLADLTASNTFEYPYKGMKVFVEENNKSYTLVGSDPTVSTNWIEDNSGGHTIKNPAGTAMTQRSNLQFVDLTVSDDSTNDATKVESVHVIHSESELNNLPDGLYMLDEDEETVIDGNLVGYDNTTSGLNAENVQDAIDEVVETLDDKANKVTNATNGNLAGLDANGNLTDSGVAASEIPALWKSQGEYGVKNLIPYPYIQSTKTQNGITFTSYSDGSVLVNGTATNDANFEVLRKSDDSLGGYWMTGGKSNGLLMRQRIVAKTGGTYIRDKRDTGSGILLDNIDASTEMYYILVYVMNGTSVNNETVYPMIRLAADTDDTYRPYAKTNKQLTDEVAENIEDIDTINDKLADMPYFKVVNGAIAIVTEE